MPSTRVEALISQGICPVCGYEMGRIVKPTRCWGCAAWLKPRPIQAVQEAK